MRKGLVLTVTLCALFTNLIAQTTPQGQRPREMPADDVIRITTDLVQTDVVVADKNDEIISDLKLNDFEVYDNGKKQDLQFMEFISVSDDSRSEGTGVARIAPGIEAHVATDTTAADLRRVIGFVVDDVTIPSEDMSRVRELLLNFIDNQMRNGDLVAIVRTVGGRGLLEQFTADRQILKRSVNQLGVRSIPPHLAFGGEDPGRIISTPAPFGDATATDTVTVSSEGPTEGTNQIPRAVLGLSVSNQVVDSLRQIPGRKNLILLSGGLPLFEMSRSGSIVGDVTQMFRLLTDNALRSGVVINTMDVRGLKTSGAVAKFDETPAKSALGGGTFAGADETPGFGRGIDSARLGDRPFSDQLTLRMLASMTGGVSVVNTSNFPEGLTRVLKRSRGYYRLAYHPSERFDNKFHKLDIKVKRSGVQIYTSEGYVAREQRSGANATKEEQIVKAAISPLAKRDLDVAAELQYMFPDNAQADLTINAFINARTLDFKKVGDKYRASFDVVGFVFDQVGRSKGGISQTVNTDLSDEEYKRALATGLTYTANTQAAPGYYQVRLVVRESETGKIGTVSRYFEVPDLSQKHLTMSSVMLYQVDPAAAKKSPDQLAATRVISRKHDLRYATVVYNAKSEGNKSDVRSRLVISAGDKILFQEPEQRVETSAGKPGQLIRVGQLALAKVPPGKYVLTLIITDSLADKKRQTVSRSIDFTVVD